MKSEQFLERQFEENRPHLRAVAYRILGSTHDVDDALQDAWLRLSSANAADIENVTGWLTTVVARICLNTLRTRARRPAGSLDDLAANTERFVDHSTMTPEEQAVVAESMGVALLVVLEMLAPAERISFVMHDMFSFSFEEVGQILGKSSEACRQLASRARRRVRTAEDPTIDPHRQRQVVDAFLIASKSGDFQMLLSLLSPDVALIADDAAVAIGAPERRDGPIEVATRFSGGAKAARTAYIDGRAGLVWNQGGQPKVAFDFTVVEGMVTRIDMIGDEEVLSELIIEYPDREKGG